jgi:hypothetical protein
MMMLLLCCPDRCAVEFQNMSNVLPRTNQLRSVRSASGRFTSPRNLGHDPQMQHIVQMRSLFQAKPIGLLVVVSSGRCRPSTSTLSTLWSTTVLMGTLILELASRLDAFSGYPFRT